MADLHPDRHSVFRSRTLAGLSLPRQPDRRGNGHRRDVPAHPCTVLLCRVCQARVRRRAARCRPDGPLHDCDLHGPAAARGAGRDPLPHGSGNDGHLDLVADRLGRFHGAFHRALCRDPVDPGKDAGVRAARSGAGRRNDRGRRKPERIPLISPCFT